MPKKLVSYCDICTRFLQGKKQHYNKYFMSFSSLGLPKTILDALTENQYKKPYPIQKKAIPAILKGQDVLGIAKTGSGKTAAFALPILSQLQEEQLERGREISVLVLVPTRELAIQVQEVFYTLGKDLRTPIKSLAVYGGVSINPQMKAAYGTNVLVATPGRLLELYESNAISFRKLNTLVLDEADKMLNLGFREEMNSIFRVLPYKRQNLLFSATLSNQVEEVKQLILHQPQVIQIEEEKEENLDLINQTGYWVDDEKKGPLLRHIIKSNDLKQVLIFTSSTYKADQVADKLSKNGVPAKATHSKKSQKARKDALQEFKEGKLGVLVTTDLLSRGIDIDSLPFVINYELPRSPKDYIHRIGRTGRAENPGEAISLVTPEEQHHFKVIQKKMKKWVTMVDAKNLEF